MTKPTLTIRKCPKCNAMITREGDNCPNCGTPIAAAPLAQSATVPEASPAPRSIGRGTPLRTERASWIMLAILFGIGGYMLGKRTVTIEMQFPASPILDPEANAEKYEKLREHEKKRVTAEIENLERKKTKAEAAETERAKFMVGDAVLFRKKYEGLGSFFYVEMQITNNSNVPVSQVNFMASVIEPGRAVPLAQQEIMVGIPGGIEPGEVKGAKYHLSPNDGIMGCERATFDTFQFKAKATGVLDQHRKPIFSDQFSDYDAERLETLKKQLAEMSEKQ